MARVDPSWSLDALLRDYHPHPGWRTWFAQAYAQAMEAADPATRLAGWKTAAIIFGDTHAPVFCLFVCYYGRTLVPPASTSFLGHINLCLWELGLAVPARTDAAGVLIGNVGKPDTFRIDGETTWEWLAEQLQPFGSDLERAARFAMRLTAARFGLLRGPAEPTIAQVLDESLWERVAGA
jgi:hypothetical protein